MSWHIDEEIVLSFNPSSIADAPVVFENDIAKATWFVVKYGYETVDDEPRFKTRSGLPYVVGKPTDDQFESYCLKFARESRSLVPDTSAELQRRMGMCNIPTNEDIAETLYDVIKGSRDFRYKVVEPEYSYSKLVEAGIRTGDPIEVILQENCASLKGGAKVDGFGISTIVGHNSYEINNANMRLMDGRAPVGRAIMEPVFKTERSRYGTIGHKYATIEVNKERFLAMSIMNPEDQDRLIGYEAIKSINILSREKVI